MDYLTALVLTIGAFGVIGFAITYFVLERSDKKESKQSKA